MYIMFPCFYRKQNIQHSNWHPFGIANLVGKGLTDHATTANPKEYFKANPKEYFIAMLQYLQLTPKPKMCDTERGRIIYLESELPSSDS